MHDGKAFCFCIRRMVKQLFDKAEPDIALKNTKSRAVKDSDGKLV